MSKSLLVELKRRNVFKVGFAYLVLAWIVIQVTEIAVPALRLPEWVNSLVFFLGLIGFPFALFFAWAFEITPQGVVREAEVKRDESITHLTSRKLDFIIIGLLSVALVYFIYESRFADVPKEISIADATLASAGNDADDEPAGSSIAVLPFVNMSSDTEQEYFSDGISEEILNVLAQVPNLQVTSRSSSFAFKGEKINLTEVARLLGVKNILEGSVRKSGDQLRITAQLITAGSDTHLWSNSFDRKLTVDNIFEVQDEIAGAIVDSLKSELGLKVQIAARADTNASLEARNEYLKGRFFIEKRSQDGISKALQHFTRVTELAPEYAPGWMGVAWAQTLSKESQAGDVPDEIAYEKALPSIQKALHLDPELAEAHTILGLVEINIDAAKARIALEKATELNPNQAYAYALMASLLNEPKDQELGLRMSQKAVALDPMSLVINNTYVRSLLNRSRFEEADISIQQMQEIQPDHPFVFNALGLLRGLQYRYGEQAYYARKMIQTRPNNPYWLGALATAYDQMGLQEMIPPIFEETPFSFIGHAILNERDLMLTQVRASYPRSDADQFGKMIRALAEFKNENYDQAAKYYLDIGCETPGLQSGTCYQLVFSYFQEEKIESAKDLLKKSQNFHRGHQLPFGRAQTNMALALLDGEFPEALRELKEVVNQGFIPDSEIKYDALYQPLRDHPDWISITAISDGHAEKQRAIYLKMVANDAALQSEKGAGV